MLALVVGSSASHHHEVFERLVADQARLDRASVEEVGRHERLARDALPRPARHVTRGLDVVVTVEEERRSALRSGQLAVEGRGAAAVVGRQRRQLETEPTPEAADGFDHVRSDLTTDRRDPEVAIEELEPVVTRGH